MTNRRSFFKMLGLTAGAVATVSPVVLGKPDLPPIPPVKAKKAYVSMIAGYDWQMVNHGLDSLLVCADAGDMKQKRIRCEIEPSGLNQCRIRVPRPRRSFMSWLTSKPSSQLYRLIVYVPVGLDAKGPTYADVFNTKIRKG